MKRKINETDYITILTAFISTVFIIIPISKKGFNFETDYMTVGFGLSSTLFLVILNLMNSHLLEVKSIIDTINKPSTILLSPDASWIQGADLIKELKKGDKLIASNCVSWENKAYYEKANISAMENGVHIERLYTNDDLNKEIANNHASWGKGFPWKSNLERKVYGGGLSMLDFVLAICQGQPEWVILWLYNAKAKTALYGFKITDDKVLHDLMNDFNSKWKDSNNIPL